MANPYRQSVQALLEKTNNKPGDSELLVSNITGHLIVNTNEGRKSATKKIESDLSRQKVWVNQISNSISNYMSRAKQAQKDLQDQGNTIFRDKNTIIPDNNDKKINVGDPNNASKFFLSQSNSDLDNSVALANIFKWADQNGTSMDPVVIYIPSGTYSLAPSVPGNTDPTSSDKRLSFILPSNTIINAEVDAIFTLGKNTPSSNEANRVLFYALPNGSDRIDQGINNFIWNGGKFVNGTADGINFQILHGQMIFQNMQFIRVQGWGKNVFNVNSVDTFIFKNNRIEGYNKKDMRDPSDSSIFNGDPTNFYSEFIFFDQGTKDSMTSDFWDTVTNKTGVNISTIQSRKDACNQVLIDKNDFLAYRDLSYRIFSYVAYPYGVSRLNTLNVNNLTSVNFVNNNVIDPIPNGLYEFISGMDNTKYTDYIMRSAPIHINGNQRDHVIMGNTFVTTSQMRNWIEVIIAPFDRSTSNILIKNNNFYSTSSMSHFSGGDLPYTIVGSYSSDRYTSTDMSSNWTYEIKGEGNKVYQYRDRKIPTVQQATYSSLGADFILTNIDFDSFNLGFSQFKSSLELTKYVMSPDDVQNTIINPVYKKKVTAPFVYGGLLGLITILENLQHFTHLLQDTIDRRMRDDSQYIYQYYEEIKKYLPDFITKYLKTLQIMRNIDEVNYMYKESKDMMDAIKQDYEQMLDYFSIVINDVNKLATKKEFMDYQNDVTRHNEYVKSHNSNITSDNITKYLNINYPFNVLNPIGTNTLTPQTLPETNNLK